MQNKCDFLIVGAGISGITLAERLASGGKKIIIVEKRDHIGGNCYDYEDSGILVQKYGPHIFHTEDKEVFDYLSCFTKWNSYKHRVTAYLDGKHYPIPVNRKAINMLFETSLKTEKEVGEFLEKERIKIDKIENSEDLALSRFGRKIYEAFFKDFTIKNWGFHPKELDKSVIGRISIRQNNDDYYFKDKYQGMPMPSFSSMFDKMLENKNITVLLASDFSKIDDKIKYKNLVYTGRIDEFFKYKFGELDYRCCNFKFDLINKKSFQNNSVVNYPSRAVDYTRITEFKKFYTSKSDKTIICTEYPAWKGEINYPVQNEKNYERLNTYLDEAKKFKNIYFLGRQGRFEYINMDMAVKEALNLSNKILTD